MNYVILIHETIEFKIFNHFVQQKSILAFWCGKWPPRLEWALSSIAWKWKEISIYLLLHEFTQAHGLIWYHPFLYVATGNFHGEMHFFKEFDTCALSKPWPCVKTVTVHWTSACKTIMYTMCIPNIIKIFVIFVKLKPFIWRCHF